jgi:hypothetical protein
LLGVHFKIKTDHHSLKYLLEQRMNTPQQQKWLSKLLGFDYEISDKQGKENMVADALFQEASWEGLLMAISTVSTELLQQIKESWEQDSSIQQLITELN